MNKSDVQSATAEITQAAAHLKAGRLVAFPTETVYGLGADATQSHAVVSVFEAKGRPRFNPLIVHVADTQAAMALGEFSDDAKKLARAFWPGPLTLVVPRRPDCPVADLASAGLDTLAIRVPAHPLGHALLEAAGVPVVAPSANRSGRVSPTTAAHVREELGDRVAQVLDGGACEVGIESTIVGCTGDGRPRLLRAGGIARADIEAVLGAPLAEAKSGPGQALTSPGQLRSHYAPRAQLRLNATDVRRWEALLAFGPEVPAHDGPMVNLSERGDLREAAANLFAGLRELDASGAKRIAVMPVPEDGLGEAINDRLRRAAAPRGE